MKKRKKKNMYIEIILLIILLILIIINLLIYINKFIKKEENLPVEQETQLTNNDNSIDLIKNLGERDRIQFYIGKYFECINNSNYVESYNMLYSEFKENYFPTFLEYSEYVKRTYSYSEIAIEYTNFERLGEIYVVWVNIVDPINGNPTNENKLQQKFVVKENDFNSFELSFSVQGVEE